jgi:hypothetical protein
MPTKKEKPGSWSGSRPGFSFRSYRGIYAKWWWHCALLRVQRFSISYPLSYNHYSEKKYLVLVFWGLCRITALKIPSFFGNRDPAGMIQCSKQKQEASEFAEIPGPWAAIRELQKSQFAETGSPKQDRAGI